MIEGKHVGRGFVSQMTPVSAVKTALTDLCQNDICTELAEMPRCKGRYVVKKGQKHVYVVCESSL